MPMIAAIAAYQTAEDLVLLFVAFYPTVCAPEDQLTQEGEEVPHRGEDLRLQTGGDGWI